MSETPILRASLSDAELAALLEALAVPPNEISPVGDLLSSPGDVSVEVRTALIENGWFSESGISQFTRKGRDALTKLARPQTRLSILIGNDRWFATTSAVAAGDLTMSEDLLSIARDGGVWHLSYPQPATQLVDILQEHFDLALVQDPLTFDLLLSRPEYAAFLALLDHRIESRLRAALDREYWVDESVSIDEAALLLAEGRTSENLNWMITVTTGLFPELDLGSGPEAMASGFAGLEEKGLVGRDEEGRYLPGETMHALSESLLPVIAFAGMQVERMESPGRLRLSQVAVRHGFGAILLEELVPEGVLVRSISSTDLAHVLLNFRFPESPVSQPGESVLVAPPGPSFCSQCGTPLTSGSAFCVRCGHRVEGKP
jgi:hypothetical protein